MVDFGSIAKKAQDALRDGADKLETAVKDNAGKIEGAVDKAGRFAKDKFPDKAAQIDQAAGKAKRAVPRHGDDPTTGTPTPGTPTTGGTGTGSPLSAVPTPVDTPPNPSATPEVDRTAAEAAGVDPTTPTSAGFAPPSATPEVDRIARDQG